MGVCRGMGVFVGGVSAIILCTALLLRDFFLQVGDALATVRCFSGGPKIHITQLNLCMYRKNKMPSVVVCMCDTIPLWDCMSFLIVRNSSRMACRVLLQLHMQQLDSAVMLAGTWGRAESEERTYTHFCECHALLNSDARTLDNGLVTWLCVRGCVRKRNV